MADAIRCRCVGKTTDHKSKVTQIILEDVQGNRVIYNKEYLKDQMKCGEIYVINLKLTKDGRLIESNSISDWDEYALMTIDCIIRSLSRSLNGIIKSNTLKDGNNNDSAEAIDRYFPITVDTMLDITVYRDGKTGIWIDLCSIDCDIITEFHIKQVKDIRQQEQIIAMNLVKIEKYLRKYFKKV